LAQGARAVSLTLGALLHADNTKLSQLTLPQRKRATLNLKKLQQEGQRRNFEATGKCTGDSLDETTFIERWNRERDEAIRREAPNV
jgi:hypothetical protein